MNIEKRGWKTILGGVTAILGAAFGVYSGEVNFSEALTAISQGLIAIGLGHKLDKIRERRSLL